MPALRQRMLEELQRHIDKARRPDGRTIYHGIPMIRRSGRGNHPPKSNRTIIRMVPSSARCVIGQ